MTSPLSGRGGVVLLAFLATLPSVAPAAHVDKLAMLIVLHSHYDGLDTRPGHDRIGRSDREAFFRGVYGALDHPCSASNNLVFETHTPDTRTHLYLAVPGVETVWARFKWWKVDVDDFEDMANREINPDPTEPDRIHLPLRDFLIRQSLCTAS